MSEKLPYGEIYMSKIELRDALVKQIHENAALSNQIEALEQQLKTAMESADAATVIVLEREKEIELLKRSAKKDKADAVRHILTFDRYSETAIEEYANNLEGK